MNGGQEAGVSNPASRICLCLTGATLEQDAELLRRERGYVDLVELRADFLRPDELAHLARFPALVDVPVILTLRRDEDGGRWRGTEADRRRLLRAALGGRPAAGGEGATRPNGPALSGGRRYAFADVEQDLDDPALEEAARAGGCRLIRSLHDFGGVPADLAARVRRLARAARPRQGGPGGLPKVAVKVRGSRDQRLLAEAFRELRGEEKILLGMGEFGSFSRILAGRLGSWLTYCSPGSEGEGAAGSGEAQGGLPEAGAGQLDPRTLVELYRFRQVGPGTAVYGVVGNPIAHSRSPHLHNPGFAALGLDAVYVPFLCDELPAFLRAAEALEVRGLSVTVPFKEQALRLARAAWEQPGGEGGPWSAAGAEARAVGAANTLVAGSPGRGRPPGRSPAGEAHSLRRPARGPAGAARFLRRPVWRAANTDVAGFLVPLEREAPDLLRATEAAAPGSGVTVLGAGGAARAVVYALSRRGLRVLVLNRTPARARALARHFRCEWGGLDPRGIARLAARSALIVQATTLGLDGAGDPLPEYAFRGTEIVYDLVYGGGPTPLLRRARAAGCRTISGEEMLRAQAAAQFRLFTGRDLPQA